MTRHSLVGASLIPSLPKNVSIMAFGIDLASPPPPQSVKFPWFDYLAKLELAEFVVTAGRSFECHCDSYRS
jgi:hypothetical protein